MGKTCDVRAYQKTWGMTLCIDELATPLDADLLLRAHGILMDGAVTAEGARLDPGYRQHGASA